MKKILLSLLIISVCLFTGCTKNYKTVSEYSDAMSAIKNKLGDYTIDATMPYDEELLLIKSKIWQHIQK